MWAPDLQPDQEDSVSCSHSKSTDRPEQDAQNVAPTLLYGRDPVTSVGSDVHDRATWNSVP